MTQTISGYRHVYLEGMEEASIFVHVAVSDISGKVSATCRANCCPEEAHQRQPQPQPHPIHAPRAMRSSGHLAGTVSPPVK